MLKRKHSPGTYRATAHAPPHRVGRFIKPRRPQRIHRAEALAKAECSRLDAAAFYPVSPPFSLKLRSGGRAYIAAVLDFPSGLSADVGAVGAGWFTITVVVELFHCSFPLLFAISATIAENNRSFITVRLV